MNRVVKIGSNNGKEIDVELVEHEGREGATLTIAGVKYHLERVPREELVSAYRVDLDPEYWPQADDNGYCYILAPFSL